MPKPLGKRIKQKRIKAGLAQTEVAEKVGVTQPIISQWERGRSSPNADEIEKLRAIVGRFHIMAQDPVPSGNGDESSQEDEPEASAYGVWLNRMRLERNMSVPQLAEKAKVAPATVYGIESGRIVNPQRKTRNKLQRALRKRIDPEVSEQMEQDSSVKNVGEFVDFNPHDKDDLPAEGGVYVFYDISERPVYVGQSQGIKKRILQDHKEKFWFKEPIVQTAAYVKVGQKRERLKMEGILIQFLKSNAVINKQKVER